MGTNTRSVAPRYPTTGTDTTSHHHETTHSAHSTALSKRLHLPSPEPKYTITTTRHRGCRYSRPAKMSKTARDPRQRTRPTKAIQGIATTMTRRRCAKKAMMKKQKRASQKATKKIADDDDQDSEDDAHHLQTSVNPTTTNDTLLPPATTTPFSNQLRALIPPVQVLMTSVKVSSVAINLQKDCSELSFMDVPSNAQSVQQCGGRVVRIDHCSLYYLQSSFSVSETDGKAPQTRLIAYIQPLRLHF